ncbi:hypothetical protein Y032_0204g1885 [Ancylostoma ceylanicum]|uniref:Uncharacterized protein n=1 Tax=Ancylostoma ceylanicum TaxID=53326 RepID=A0A016SLN5_9BILA|nr:hypothetical protein Y032_0204g1885 [Ancylostoma ceylanicum]
MSSSSLKILKFSEIFSTKISVGADFNPLSLVNLATHPFLGKPAHCKVQVKNIFVLIPGCHNAMQRLQSVIGSRTVLNDSSLMRNEACNSDDPGTRRFCSRRNSSLRLHG